MSGSACAHRTPETWQAATIPTDADFRGLWFVDSLNGWMTGGGYLIDGGIVGRTRDGGRTWKFRSRLVSGRSRFALGQVQFHDSLHGVAVGRAGVVLFTEDGGESWELAGYGTSSDLTDLYFLDGRLGWASGHSSLIATQDGGRTWQPLARGADGSGYLAGNAVHFTDARRGWLACRDGVLMRSDDGGAHWVRVTLPLGAGEHPTLWDVTFCDPSNGWVVGERGSIFRTRDGGATWGRQESGVPAVRVIAPGEPPRPREPIPELETEPDRLALSGVQFTDPERGCAIGYYADVGESVILRTTDGGTTWRVERVQPGEYLRALFLLGPDHGWAAGDRSRAAPQVVLRYVGARS